MRVPRNERGAALLSVLLLVAVMAAVAATALDRIGVSTRLAANAATVAQGRAWLASAELLATARVEDLDAASPNKTLPSGWMGVERTIALPDGAVVRARLDDGSNCFNLNSLVKPTLDGSLVQDAQTVRQFNSLMIQVGIGESEARQIASAAGDYIDSDNIPQTVGAEDSGRTLAANRLLVDRSELRSVAGVTDRSYGLLRSWICALPTTELSQINVNTLLPEQAPLIAMLMPGPPDPSRARAALAQRPAAGFDNTGQFWQSPAFRGADTLLAAEQVKLKTTFFLLTAHVQNSGIELREAALIDARGVPARVVQRSWADAG